MNKTILFIRGLLFFIGMVIVTLIHATLSFLFFPFKIETRYAFVTLWTRMLLKWLALTCGINHQVIGNENIPAQSSIIFCKHQSMWETLALQVIFPQQTWVLKKELLHVPFFGWALALLKPIAIDRSDKKSAMQQMLTQGKAQLNSGRWVVVFPEGTRVAPGHTHKFSKGGAVLAQESKALLVPVAHNAGNFWPRRGFIKYPGTITLIIGKPINPQNLTPAEILQQAESWINTTVAQMDSGVHFEQ